MSPKHAAIIKNSPAKVFFLPSLSIKSIVNNIPDKEKKKPFTYLTNIKQTAILHKYGPPE